MKQWGNRSAKVLLVILLAQAISSGPLWGRAPAARDREADLERKIKRETRPVRKAQLQIHLARVRLDKSLEAYAAFETERGAELLKTYDKAIQGADDTLRKSGRKPTQQPRGFKDLEIAIRRDIRVLEDLKRRVPFADRGEVQSIIDRVDQVRERVLEAMFSSSEAGLRRAPLPGEAIKLGASWAAAAAHPQNDAADLSPGEEDRLRAAQDPGARIAVYLELGATRIDKFEEFRPPSGRAPSEQGPYLNSLLNTYIACIDELKKWMEYQYDRDGDMRKGLRVLLKQGPLHLERLRRARRVQDQLTPYYEQTLEYAIENMEDTLDGGALAFGEQEKNSRERQKAEEEEKKQAKRNKKKGRK